MKDLEEMFSEEDKKKPHKVRKGEKPDDKKYIALMVEYKKLRRNPKNKDAAKKALEKASKLGREGDVSNDAKVMAAYL
jgi:hypothetical protein